MFPFFLFVESISVCHENTHHLLAPRKKEERIIAFEPRAAVSRTFSSSSTQHLPANPRTRKDVHVSKTVQDQLLATTGNHTTD